MKFLKAYTVKDCAAGIWSAPFFAVNDAVACRRYVEVVSGVPHGVEFELWYHGFFDTESGELTVDGQFRVDVLDYTGGQEGLEFKLGAFRDFVAPSELKELQAQVRKLTDSVLGFNDYVGPMVAYATKKGWLK